MTGNNVKSTGTTKNKSIFNFFKGIKAEIKRITWPSKNETKKALIAVAIYVIIFIILVGGLDFIFQNIFELILKIK